MQPTPRDAPKPLVVKLGGAVCDDAATLDAFADAWRSRPADAGACFLVHGGGPQLDAALRALGEPVAKVQGLRVTSPAAAHVVREVLDQTGAALAHALRDRGLPAVHLPATLHLFAAHAKRVPQGEVGRVGTVDAFDAEALARCVPSSAIGVVTPVAWDAEGPLNVNADEGAAAVAGALGAERLLLATDVAHVLDATGAPIAALTPDEALRLLAGPAAKGGMVPKLHAALEALAHGVGEVTIGRLEGAWSGVGTRLCARREVAA